MNNSFPRIITLLRKERGLSQKNAAAALGISQALLSHYEKGIRECGLDFVVKTAEFYNVSTDYLLGRSPNRTGAIISIDELPDGDLQADAKQNSMLPILNKKLLSSSINVIYSILQEYNNRQLTGEISSYLYASAYDAFRLLYSANNKNPQGMFTVPKSLYNGYCNALAAASRANAKILAKGQIANESKLNASAPELTPDFISQEYPAHSTALFNMVSTTEEKIQKLIKPE